MQNKKQAFTLVELIVVISILAILGTIATLSLLGYSEGSRDTSRLANISEIDKVLELYKIDNGEYPIPTGGIEITYIGSEVWTQGEFGKDILKKTRDLSSSSDLVDPLTSIAYTYSRLNTGKEYELATIMETTDYVNNFKLIDSSFAGSKEATVKITGNYNQQVASVKNGNTTYVLAVPTIISGDVTLTDILDQVSQKKLLFDGYKNLPANYIDSKFNINGEVDLTVVNDGKLVVFSGSLDDLKIEANQLTFISNLQDAYNYTTTVGESNIEDIVYYNSLNTQGLLYIAQTIINTNFFSNLKITATNEINPDFTCTTGAVGTYNPDGYYIVDRAELDQVILGNVIGVTVSDVCTTQVTDMSELFIDMITFNENISNFDTSNVIDMSSMFDRASVFNQPLDSFDTSNVTNMYKMFNQTDIFNQSLDNFNTSNVINMSSMFRYAKIFNQPLMNFDTSSVINMGYMFYGSTLFNQPLDSFDTSKVTSMLWMFAEATSFNKSLNTFNTSIVTNMSYMFYASRSFNQPLINFNISEVINMKWMFYHANAFNKDLTLWDSQNNNLITICDLFDGFTYVWETINKPTFANCIY